MVVLSVPHLVEPVAIKSVLDTVLHILLDKVGLIVYCGVWSGQIGCRIRGAGFLLGDFY